MGAENRIVILTPVSRGPIGTVRLEGPGVRAFLETVLRHRSGKLFSAAPGPRPRLAHLALGSYTVEEVVVHIPDETTAEFHCHGNPLLLRQVVQRAVQSGFREESWEDWVKSVEQDEIRASARIALADATTWKVARILLDQYGGALRQAVSEIQRAVRRRQWKAAQEQVREILRWERLGFHLTRPWKVALIGPPNAGKSSLLNWLVGYERAIVHPTPGTTRDFVTAVTAVEGWPVEFYDTAGLRTPADMLEEEAIRRTLRIAAEADLVVLVFDRSTAWCAEYERLAESWPSGLLVFNKRDLQPGSGSWPSGMTVSTLIPEDRDKLLRELSTRLVPEEPPPGAPVPFTEEQRELLNCFQKAIQTEDLTRAGEILVSLLETSSPG